MTTPLTEPPELALWLFDHAPIHRIAVAPGAKVYCDPDRIHVIIQGDGAARLLAWQDLEPLVDLKVTPNSVLQLRPPVVEQVRAWLAFMEEDHSDLPVHWEFEDKLPADIGRSTFHAMFSRSSVRDGVRMYPYVEIAGGRRHYLRAL